MKKFDRFEGCIIGGAIGDAWGSSFEGQFRREEDTFYLFGNPPLKDRVWGITDDTQLTLATIDALKEDENLLPEILVEHFLKLYKKRILKGIGASTLKALRELEVGGHWSQVGRRGEYAAGNGAAMRIAPVAFFEHIEKLRIREVCSITHNNDDAYVGAWAIVIAIREILKGNWTGRENLIEMIISQIPDTRVRDRLIAIEKIDLDYAATFGNSGFVVDSIPLAIKAASEIDKLGFELMISKVIEIGGDTDTNASIAGQIAGALIGIVGIPQKLLDKLSALVEYPWINETVNSISDKMN